MDSTRLPERKTDHGNGVTRHLALINGRCDEQGTTRTLMLSRIPQEANAFGQARGYALRGDDDREERGTSRMSETKAPKSRQKPLPDPASESWRTLPWRKFEQHIYRLQKRIFQASQHGNTQAVHKLQKLLTKSRAARLLAVRGVTQDNQGKNTAGIDGIKAVAPQQRLTLAEHIHPKQWEGIRPRPVRRVWIPKPGKAEKRPLGIPVMLDRAHQCLIKLALEPQWEARFEPNSYGCASRPLRPGCQRSHL